MHPDMNKGISGLPYIRDCIRKAAIYAICDRMDEQGDFLLLDFGRRMRMSGGRDGRNP